MTSPINAAALRTVGKSIGDCDESDLDRIIAAALVRAAAAGEDLATAKAVKAQRKASA